MEIINHEKEIDLHDFDRDNGNGYVLRLLPQP